MSKTILYREEREEWSGDWLDALVEVELREWSDDGKSDVILASRVNVDGKTKIDDRKVIGERYINDNDRAAYIRQAIAEFDRLLESHPTLRETNEQPA
jgi:hypothetical protein